MPADAWTIPEVMACRRRDDARLQALVSDDGSITWGELDDASRALAGRMVRDGLGKGDRIGLLMPNGIDWATAALAVMRMGAVLVPLSTLLRPPELLAQLRVASVSHLIAARSYRGRSYLDEIRSLAPVPALRRVWAWGGLPDAPMAGSFVDALEAVVRPADDMVILFTSGSRGAPKGVIHTHGSALRATAAGLEARCIGAGERLYIPMPFFWTGGFGGGLLSVLLAGATLLTESTPEPSRTIRFLERERVTLFRGWPDQAARIAAHPDFASADLSSLRPASLAAVLPPAQRPRAGARANLFGMTESGGPYCGARLDLDLPAEKHGSCGRPFAGVEVRIVDGEIQLRGPNLMRGICGRIRSELFDADGYYSTGDLGSLDVRGAFASDTRIRIVVPADAVVDTAMLHGSLHTVFGWKVHVGQISNPRSLRNFPMQANGAEMMRLAACLATERGLGVCCPVHDAFMIEADAEAIVDDTLRMQEAMQEASEVILPGFPLRTDAKIVRHPERYSDGRGLAMWRAVLGILERVQGCSNLATGFES
jgi:acyl-CoA synthetase (AMP-forming)/AMP-acid ligase II